MTTNLICTGSHFPKRILQCSYSEMTKQDKISYTIPPNE